jgi:ATP/maltotriose-dependent transcriptional regulator MalT
MPLRTLDRCDLLLGRDAERASIHDLVSHAADRGGVVAIVGDAGLGKTALLRDGLSDALARGFRTIAVSGDRANAGIPFSGVQPLVRSFLSGDAPRRVPDCRLEEVFDPTAAVDIDPVAIGRALLTLVRPSAADPPVVMAVDDLHLFDLQSRHALVELFRLAADETAILIATRDGREPQASPMRVPLVELHGLDDSDSRVLLERHAPRIGYAEREHVLACAAGNPLALIELPKTIMSSSDVVAQVHARETTLTPALQRSFAQGTNGLSPAGRDALLIAAVNDENKLHELVAAAGLMSGRDIAVDAFDEAVRMGLLFGNDMQLQFRHPLVQCAVLHEETLARRQQAHRAVAAVVGDGPRRVWHEAHSVPVPNEHFGDELEAAYPAALGRGTVPAISLLARAAQLSEDPRKRAHRYLRAASHACSLGRADVVDRLVTAANQHQLPAHLHAYARVLQSNFAFVAGEEGPHIGELCEVAERASADHDSDVAVDLLLAAAERSWWTGADSATRDKIDAATRALPEVADDARVLAILALCAPIQNGRTVIRRLAGSDTVAVSNAATLHLLGLAAHLTGDSLRATSLLKRAEHACRSEHLLGRLSQVLCISAATCIEIGDFERAARQAAEAIDIAEGLGQWNWVAMAKAHLALANALQDDVEAAERMAGDAEHLAGIWGWRGVTELARIARGAAWLSAGRHLEAVDELSHPFDSSYGPNDRERITAVMLFVEAATRAGRVSEARTILADLEDLALATPSPLLHVQLNYARGVLKPDTEAERCFVDALSQDLHRWPWVRARIELAFGGWLRRQRRSVESRKQLRAACATFELISAPAWADHASLELRAAGERRGASEVDIEQVLSPQELEITRLAAAGLSNREIGQQLLLSHRTVGAHLYRVFPKLGITSRRQLAARLALIPGQAVVAA